MGRIRRGTLDPTQSTNGFIYCAQFCNYNRDVVMAVGGSTAKFFSAEEKNEILDV